jgi:hypothetical protein
MAIAITTIEKVKDYMGITDTDKDLLFTDWLEYVSGAIEDHINQPVVSREVTEYLDGNGSDTIWLNRGRIISLKGTNEAERLASLQYDVDGTWTDLLTDEDDLFIDGNPNWFIQLLDSTFPYGTKNIKITYNCGFSTVPPSITKVCLEMMQVMYDESRAGLNPRLGMSSKSNAAAGSSVGDNFIDMTPRWKSALARYRRVM